jgi:hypothetical protein
LDDAQPEALDELVDATRRDATHIGLLDDRQQRLLRAPARLQKAREVAARRILGICSSTVPRASATARPIAVAMRRPILGRRSPSSRRSARDLELHQLRRDGLDRLADHVACSSSNTFLTTSSIVILSAPATRRLLSSNREKSDDLQRRVGRNHVPSDPTYTTLRDVTTSRAAVVSIVRRSGVVTAATVVGRADEEPAPRRALAHALARRGRAAAGFGAAARLAPPAH